MRTIYLFKFYFLLFLFFSGCGITREKEISGILIQIREKYLHDTRIALFDVDISRDGNLSITGETTIAEAFGELDSILKTDWPGIDNNVVLLPGPSPDSLTMGIVTVSAANMRKAPDHSAELVTQAIPGTPVKILKKEAGWYLVQTPDDYLGWTTQAGIKPYTEKDLSGEIHSERIIFTGSTGTCWSEPDENSLPVSDLVAGSILSAEDSGKKFIEVRLPDGRQGYILKDQCIPLDIWKKSFPPEPASVVRTALGFTGIPYLWGGTSTKGFDCSGFTKTVYFMNGIILQRDASQQALYGEPVDTRGKFENLLPGDLLFFGTHKTDSTKEKISHVGIYIGNGEMIHSSGMVKINSLVPGKENYSSGLAESFIIARRILTCIDQPGIQSVFDSKLYFPVPD